MKKVAVIHRDLLNKLHNSLGGEYTFQGEKIDFNATILVDSGDFDKIDGEEYYICKSIDEDKLQVIFEKYVEEENE